MIKHMGLVAAVIQYEMKDTGLADAVLQHAIKRTGPSAAVIHCVMKHTGLAVIQCDETYEACSFCNTLP